MMGEVLVAALIYIGAFFTLVGSLGLARLPDFYARLHGPTKATTLGVGSLLLASMVFFVVVGDGLRLHKVLITVFLFLTAPVSGHLMAKAGLRLRVSTDTAPPTNPGGHLQEQRVATMGEEVRPV